jgi:hypothetical protein
MAERQAQRSTSGAEEPTRQAGDAMCAATMPRDLLLELPARHGAAHARAGHRATAREGSRASWGFVALAVCPRRGRRSGPPTNRRTTTGVPMADARTVTVPEAARILSKTPDAARGLVRRGTLVATRGNDGRPRVILPDGRETGATTDQPPLDEPATVATGGTGATPGRDGDLLVADLRDRLGKTELEAVELRRQVADLRVELATAKTEVTAKEALVVELREQVAWHRQPWWRRWRG